jgi:glycosyltransferase involved in cell wall biosynthesis
VASISLYPTKNEKHSSSGGVASYTKNLIANFDEGTKSTVFANIIDKKEAYSEDNTDVIRCWLKKASYPIILFKKLYKNKKNIDVVHIQHEFFLYGGSVSAAFFPLLVFLAKILNPVVITFHGVVPLSQMNKPFLKENGLSGNPSILKIGLYLIAKSSSLFANKIIVHDELFKQNLVKEYGIEDKKIEVIPHGIEQRSDKIPQAKAKKQLGLTDKKVVLYMGYITGYKGIDVLIDSFEHIIDEETVLLLAGGEHPRLKGDPKYQRYLNTLKEKAKTFSDKISFMGFVKEEDIPLVFSAADVVVFPYTVAMASSGPMSLAITYEKPILVSEEIKETIGEDGLAFKREPRDVADKITDILLSEDLYNKALDFARKMRSERDWKAVSKKHEEVYKSIIK